MSEVVTGRRSGEETENELNGCPRSPIKIIR